MFPINTTDPFTPQANRVLPFDTTTGGSSGTGSSTNGTSSSGSSNQLTGNSFLTLLAAQLKAQDPLNPIDPTTFVTQLVQFNQLQQLIDINQTLSPSTAAAQNAAASTAAQNLATQLSSAVPATSIF
jgi:flagellar basal-body rod modification protein FlgD